MYWNSPERNPGSKPTYDPENLRSISNIVEFPWKYKSWGTPAPAVNWGTQF